MKSWQRITLVTFVLIGGTMSFGYWSLNQFDNAFDNLSASQVANTLTVSSSFKKDEGLASTSPETFATSATSTPETTPTETATSTTDLELSFTFPKKGDGVYIGCTYSIPWQSSTTISSLEIALIDSGTGEAAGPIASGLAKENTIKTDSQNLNWKVGVVWPGEYYIAVSKINGVDLETKSKFFVINKMPTNISTDEQENVCKESGGSF